MLRATVALLSIGAVLLPGSVSATTPANGAEREAAPPASPATFAISGHGWGHGVGMSQYGAYGFAQKGRTYPRILAHYYRGTTLGPAPVGKVRVLLASGQGSVSVASTAAFSARGADGKRLKLPAGTYTVGPGLKLRVPARAKPAALGGPLLFVRGTAPLTLNGTPYRGSLEVGLEQGALRVINQVELESYVAGVVPHEMPHTWHPEALKAQAVAARSFALALRAKGGDFDLYNDTRSQVYGGIEAEEPETNAAVKATGGKVLLHRGKVITAFYFSTSGGRTANVEDVFAGSPVPYLVSVPDPYDSISPLHSWGPFPVSAARLARALGVRGSLLDVRITSNPSQRVEQVTGVGAAGEASVAGPDFRTAFGLRSTWFSVGVLSLDRPARPYVYGAPTKVTGTARGLDEVALEKRLGDGSWQGAGKLQATKDGSFAVPVALRASTEFRLAAGSLRSAPVRLDVAPLVRLLPAKEDGVLRGRVKPVLDGSVVIVERQSGSSWKPAARSTIGDKGAFTVKLALTPGSYRARVPAGRGFAAGVSAVLEVQQPARFAVGLASGVSAERVAARVAAATEARVTNDGALGALTLESRRTPQLGRIPGVAWVERIDVARRPAFTTNDPLLPRQWYLEQVRAFDAWEERPPLAPVRVAVIDSGIDAGHPEFEGRIAAGRSFVGGDWRNDRQGHGTFVAGLIAANSDNEQGIAGIGISAELLVAKVVRGDRSISLEAEARAIRWAVDQGAQVINLSLGGLRDPLNPSRDTFSPLEAAAVAYAYSKGAVVVAAVGNSDQAPRKPWPFASYPSALPHVLGVSAVARDGSVPLFSDRDRIFNDVAAPGQEIVSTVPRALTAAQPGCKLQGYSDCGPDEYKDAEGTSFAAPQASAAAALLLGVDSDLSPDQVMHLLTRTAVDMNPSTGCRKCSQGRDSLAGWGRLDVTAAISRAVARQRPAPDRYETNDDAGDSARRVYGPRGNNLTASVDFWDDQVDVYQVRLREGQRLWVSLKGPSATKVFLWTPGTRRVEGFLVDVDRRRVAQSSRRGAAQRFGYKAPKRSGGWYYLQVKIGSPGAGPYTLSWTKR